MNESIMKLLKDRYFLSTESSWDDISKRVSALYPPIYEYIRDMEFIPSTPTLLNANTKGERLGTLSSCFPMGVEDSIEGIFKSLGECAEVTKNGGGVGYDFSKLRSSKELVSKINRVSSGPLPFIDIFNSTLEGIQQGGVRRGAGLALLSIYHPDIISFINAKNDITKFVRFNFSVKIDNIFYNDLKKNPDKIHQVIYKNGKVEDLIYNKKPITKKQLWDMIIEKAWKSAEPGIFNETIAMEENSVANVSTDVCGNPCLTGDTIIAVADGRNGITIKQLAEESNNKIKFPVYSAKNTKFNKISGNWRCEIKNAVAFKTGTKKIIQVILSNGDSFKCTPDHLLALKNGEYIKAKDSLNSELAKFITYTETKGKKYRHINSITNGHSKQHRLIWEFFNERIKKGYVIDHIIPNGNDCVSNLQCILTEEHNKKTSIEKMGINNGIHKIKNNKGYLNNLCRSRIGENNPRFKEVSDLEIIELAKKLKNNGEIISIENLRKLNKNIPKGFSKNRFNGKISILRKIVNEEMEYTPISIPEYIDWKENYKIEEENKINNLLENLYVKEIIDNNEYEDVYDLTVEDNNNFYIITSGDENYKSSKGVLVHNCVEFISIPYSSCNLGSINLTKFVENKLINWEQLKDTIIKSTYFLNSVIDNNFYSIEKIKEITLGIRPIGLGIMGLAHLFYLLEIPYNSKKAENITFDIMRFITLISMQVSINLAKENGSYKFFDYNVFMKANKKFFENSFIKSHLNDLVNIEQMKKDIKKYGVYNCYFTSIAPTGSISFMANTSSGIEPIFALSYSRKIEKLNKEYDAAYISDPIFDEYLNKNYSKKDKEIILKYIIDNNGSCQKCNLIPEKDKNIFVVAGDISPIEHLNILKQAANQTSLSVSKTVNLPKDATIEDVSQVYLTAHQYNIKGTTVYRDGSREGILVHKNGNGDRIIERNAPKRPKSLPCHVYRITVHGEKWIVFVSLYKGHPYEVFSGKVDLVDIPSNIEEGNLVKIKKGLYQFEHNDEILIKDITKLFESGVEEALTRQISTNLRHGTPIEFIIQQLEKSKGTVVDFNKSILRALKRYLKEGSDSGMTCPECGNKLIFFDGCKKCSSPDCTAVFCG